MTDDNGSSLLERAASQFAPGFTNPRQVGTASHLLRVTAGDRDLVIRQWPESTRPDNARLAVAALALAHAAGSLYPEPVTQPDEVIAVDRRWFSATAWLPGQPLARYGDFRLPDGRVIDVPLPASAPSPEVVAQAARGIGAFHVATASLAEGKGAGHPLNKLLGGAERAWATQRRRVGREAADFPEIRRWLRCGNRVVPVATELLRQAGEAGNRTAVVHGDLWPANLLVEGSGEERKLAGIAGWSSMKVDSPLIDIAHLVTHMSGWSGARAEDVLGAYTDAAPLSPLERRLLPVVAAVDLLPTVGDLLLLAFVDERVADHESQPVLRSGLKALLTSLENLTYVLAPDEEWGQRQTTTARHERRTDRAKTARGTRTKPAPRRGSGRSPQR